MVVQSNVEPKFIYLYQVIENDLDHQWMITGNIFAPLQLEMINIIGFFHPWMIQKWSFSSMGNRITKSWRKQCVGPSMASTNIKIHYGVYVDDVGPFVLVTKERIHLSKLIHALVVLPPPSQLKALACTYIKLVFFCSFAPLWHPLGLCTFGSDLGSSLSLCPPFPTFAGCYVYIKKCIRVSSVFPKFWKGHLYTTYYGESQSPHCIQLCFFYWRNFTKF